MLHHDSTSFLTLNNGQVSLGAAYGGYQWVNNDIYDKPYFTSSGGLGFHLGQFPLVANFRISDLAFHGGRANQFNIKFDALQYYKDRLDIKKKDELLSKVNIDSLQLVRQNFAKRLAYLKLLKANNNFPSITIRPSSKIDALGNVVQDSLNLPIPDTLTLDMVNSKIIDLQSQYEDVNSKIDEYKDLVQQKRQLEKLKLNGTGKFSEQLKHLQMKQFQIGTCTPALSELMLANTRLLGLYISTESDRWHGDVAAGWMAPQFAGVINPIDLRPGLQWRNLMAARSGRLIYGRTGYGKLAATHLYVSILSGKDKLPTGLNAASGERSSVNVELDGQWVFKSQKFSAKAARRLERDIQSNPELNNTPASSNIALSSFDALWSMEWKKTKSQIDATYRWIGPQYYSVGNPYLLGDNARMNLSIRNSAWKYLQPSLLFSNQRNDVLNQHSYSSELNSMGIELMSRPLQCLIIKLMYAPSSFTRKNGDITESGRTNLYNASVVYNRNWNKAQWVNQIAVNRSAQLWDSLIYVLDNALLSTSLTTAGQWQIGLNAQYIKMSDHQNATTEYALISAEAQSNAIKGWSIGLEGSLCQSGGTTWGGQFQLSKNLSSSMQWSVLAEKYVQPALSGTINPLARNMPFFFQSQVTYSFTKKK
jgi:hypothetical protein